MDIERVQRRGLIAVLSFALAAFAVGEGLGWWNVI